MATSGEEGGKNVCKRVSKYSNLGHLCSPGWLQSLEKILPCRWKKSRSYKVDIIRSATFYLKWLQIGDFYLSKGLRGEACNINADELEALSKGCGGIGRTKKKGRRGRGMSKTARSPSANEVTSSCVTERAIQPVPSFSADENKLSAISEPPLLCMPADPMWSYSSLLTTSLGSDNQALNSGFKVGAQEGTKAFVFSIDDKSLAVSGASTSTISSSLIPTTGCLPNTIYISSQAESPLKSVMAMDLFPSQHFHSGNFSSPVHAETYQLIASHPALSPWQVLSPTAEYPDNFLSTCRTLTSNNIHETPSYHQLAHGQGWTFGTSGHETPYHSSFNHGIPVTSVPDPHDGTVYQPLYNQCWTNGTNLYESGSCHSVDNRQGWGLGAEVGNSSHISTHSQEWTVTTDTHGNALYHTHYGQGWKSSRGVQEQLNGALNTGMASCEDKAAKNHGQMAQQNEKIKVKKVKIASKQINLNPFIKASGKSGLHIENVDASQQLFEGGNKENLNEITVQRVRYNDKGQVSVVTDIMPSHAGNFRQPLAAINS